MSTINDTTRKMQNILTFKNQKIKFESKTRTPSNQSIYLKLNVHFVDNNTSYAYCVLHGSEDDRLAII